MRLRTRYLLLRKRLIPWCIRPGCWERSYKPLNGTRGNVCPVHAWEALMSVLEDEEFDDE